ncbi:MAG: inositol monophosphatase [Chloroflexi bacterium]|nr:inositol monophosphatase [Chloroflexota bacterium]MCI0577620.1 inositol monophosphatase [Chloroflexota bacterium]MCI0644160.1 inositol monophosphatase [Chloroflexota bacterium]MCI0725257.1 inositol monophosphatase [Chloroflexota bacterium]
MGLPHSYLDLLETAQAAAAPAGEWLRQQWQQPRQVSNKGFRDWVTDADKASQAIITSLIRQRFPDHGFLTEEEASLPAHGPVVWIIDPVDGTSNYSRQQPNFCLSIATAMPRDLPGPLSGPAPERPAPAAGVYHVVAGVIYDPLRDEMFSAAAGHGSHLNDHPLQVSQIDNLGEAIVALDWSRHPEKRQLMLAALGHFAHHVHTIRALGSAALALAWLAAGRLDAYCHASLSAWDAAAGSLIIAEAGGQVTNAQGHPWSLDDGGCVASNGRLHASFLALLEGL